MARFHGRAANLNSWNAKVVLQQPTGCVVGVCVCVCLSTKIPRLELDLCSSFVRERQHAVKHDRKRLCEVISTPNFSFDKTHPHKHTHTQRLKLQFTHKSTPIEKSKFKIYKVVPVSSMPVMCKFMSAGILGGKTEFVYELTEDPPGSGQEHIGWPQSKLSVQPAGKATCLRCSALPFRKARPATVPAQQG